MISSTAYPSSIYAVIFTASFWCWILFEAWVLLRERGASRDSSRDRGSTFTVLMILGIGIALGLNMSQIVPQFNITTLFVAFFALGIAMIFGGMTFRLWSIQTLGRFFRTRVMIQEQHQFITAGPYKYLRNPSYTGVVVLLTGFGFALGNWISVLVFCATGIIAYAWRISRVEEPALAAQFGPEFQDYKKRTWALIPYIW